MSEKTIRLLVIAVLVITVVISIAYVIHLSTQAALAMGAAGAAATAAAAAARRRSVGREAEQARTESDRIEARILEVAELAAQARDRAAREIEQLSAEEKARLGDDLLSGDPSE